MNVTPNLKEKREVVDEIIRKYKDTTFQGHVPAFDGKKNLYSRIRLPVGNGQGVVSKVYYSIHIVHLKVKFVFFSELCQFVSPLISSVRFSSVYLFSQLNKIHINYQGRSQLFD